MSIMSLCLVDDWRGMDGGSLGNEVRHQPNEGRRGSFLVIHEHSRPVGSVKEEEIIDLTVIMVM